MKLNFIKNDFWESRFLPLNLEKYLTFQICKLKFQETHLSHWGFDVRWVFTCMHERNPNGETRLFLFQSV